MKKIAFWCFTLVVLLTVNYIIIQKEDTISDGRTMLLKLAPRDPRSLIQGDYMVLRYEIAREIRGLQVQWDSEKQVREVTGAQATKEMTRKAVEGSKTRDREDSEAKAVKDSANLNQEDRSPQLDDKGHIVIVLDENDVAGFVRVHRGEALGEGEYLLLYRDRGGLRLGAESFMFQEGDAEIYSDAVYGELKVDESGKSVLVGLRDKYFAPLGKLF